jgi:hypothetical protein
MNKVRFLFGFSPLNELRVSAPSAAWVAYFLPMRQEALVFNWSRFHDSATLEL